jgi:hypothetical protein
MPQIKVMKVSSDSKVNISSSSSSSNQSGNVDQLDDCLPLFPTTNTNTNKTNNPSKFQYFLLYQIKYCFRNKASSITSANGSTTTKKGGIFDDLQDLLVDQSTGQKLSSTKR